MESTLNYMRTYLRSSNHQLESSSHRPESPERIPRQEGHLGLNKRTGNLPPIPKEGEATGTQAAWGNIPIVPPPAPNSSPTIPSFRQSLPQEAVTEALLRLSGNHAYGSFLTNTKSGIPTKGNTLPSVSTLPTQSNTSMPIPSPTTSNLKFTLENAIRTEKTPACFIVKHKGIKKTYKDLAFYADINLNEDSHELTKLHPFGWTDSIENWARENKDHFPDFTHGTYNELVEAHFIDHVHRCAAHTGSLEWYLKTVHAIQTGHTLQWLLSQTQPYPDTLFLRIVFTRLYALAKKFQVHILHTKLGVRFLIPEHIWEAYRTWSPDIQGQFASLVWAYLHNGSIAVMANAFDAATARTRAHYTSLISREVEYLRFNEALVNELLFFNDPLDLPFFPEWPPASRKVTTPYAKISLTYHDKCGEWNASHCACDGEDADTESNSGEDEVHYNSE